MIANFQFENNSESILYFNNCVLYVSILCSIEKPHNLIEFLYIVEVHQKDQVIVVLHVSYQKQKNVNKTVGCTQITSLTDLKNCDPSQIKLRYLQICNVQIINLTQKCKMPDENNSF